MQRLPDGRPRLNLKPRTVPAAEIGKAAPAAGKSSIFGDARPVDTAAREREIEERLRRSGRPRDRLSPQRRDDGRPPAETRHDDRRPPARRGSADDRRPPSRQDSAEERRPPQDDRRPPHDDRRPPSRQDSAEDRRPPYDDRRPPYDDRRPPSRQDPADDRRRPGKRGSEDKPDDRRPPGRQESEERRRREEDGREDELSYKQRRAEAYRDIRCSEGGPQRKAEFRRPPADSAPVSCNMSIRGAR